MGQILPQIPPRITKLYNTVPLYFADDLTVLLGCLRLIDVPFMFHSHLLLVSKRHNILREYVISRIKI